MPFRNEVDDYVAMIEIWTGCEFSQDTGVNTPTLTISTIGFFVTTERRDTCLTSHPKWKSMLTRPSCIGVYGRATPLSRQELKKKNKNMINT